MQYMIFLAHLQNFYKHFNLFKRFAFKIILLSSIFILSQQFVCQKCSDTRTSLVE